MVNVIYFSADANFDALNEMFNDTVESNDVNVSHMSTDGIASILS